MENLFAPYECQFSPKERKLIVAQVLRELRIMHKYSQKEVAGILGLSQPGYNGYETGRTEPPLEILVRLSYLYKVSMDIIVQKGRLYRTTADIQEQMEQASAELERAEEALCKNELDNPQMKSLLDAMKALTKGMKEYSEQPNIKEQLESALDQSNQT